MIVIIIQITTNICFNASGSTTHIINPIDDAYLLKNLPDDNTGSFSFMNVRNTLSAGNQSDRAYDSLIRFEIPTIPIIMVIITIAITMVITGILEIEMMVKAIVSKTR